MNSFLMKRGVMQVAAVLGLTAWLMGAMQVAALTPYPLTEQERAAYGGATHVVTISETNLTETTTNTAQTLTVSIDSNYAFRVVAFQLDKAFSSGNTGYTGSLALEIGDGDDADRYLTSTEMDSDGTEVLFKYGRQPELSLTTVIRTNAQQISYQTAVITNGATSWTAVTNITQSTVTQTVATAGTVSNLNWRIYGAADTIDFVFTPNAEESTSSATTGQARVFYRLDPVNP